jgi:hypothetical protein
MLHDNLAVTRNQDLWDLREGRRLQACGVKLDEQSRREGKRPLQIGPGRAPSSQYAAGEYQVLGLFNTSGVPTRASIPKCGGVLRAITL